MGGFYVEIKNRNKYCVFILKKNTGGGGIIFARYFSLQEEMS